MQHSPWHEAIKSHLPEGVFFIRSMTLWMKSIARVVYPSRDKVFKALQTTEMDQVKVLILGQDPYHGPDQAQGLSFSVPDHVPAPPSLQNILKELRSDIGEAVAWSDLLGRSKGYSCSMPVWQFQLVRLMVMQDKFGSLSQMLWSRWSMSWRSQLSLSSGDLMPVRKSLWLPTIDIWSLNQLTQVPYRPTEDFLVPNLFKNQSIFERGGTLSRLIG